LDLAGATCVGTQLSPHSGDFSDVSKEGNGVSLLPLGGEGR
jgi:hypothetical protein